MDDAARDMLCRNARTMRKWSGRPVAAETLHAVYDVMKLAPACGDRYPARIVFEEACRVA